MLYFTCYSVFIKTEIRSPKLRYFGNIKLLSLNDHYTKISESVLIRGGYTQNSTTEIAQIQESSEVSSIALVCGTTVGAGILALPRYSNNNVFPAIN